MGVHNLWPVLENVRKDINFVDLQGKRVAVDLSCWVMQAKTAEGLNRSKKSYLRNVFFRTRKLLINGILPVFVMEGQAPDCKGRTIKKRLKHTDSDAGSGDLSRSSFDVMLRECQELLNLMGVPCIRSSGEAESFCAFLNSCGLVDGCITEDNDAFLYGAQTVFRSFTTHQSKEDHQLAAYKMSDIEEKLKLDRDRLIALALLLGCDYGKGVAGVGVSVARNLLSELRDRDILQRFRDWKQKSHSELFPSLNPELEQKVSHCTRCSHPGKQREHKASGCRFCGSEVTCYQQKKGESCHCEWHMNSARKEQMKTELKVYQIISNMEVFPDEEVISEYMNTQNTLPDENEVKWTAPDIPGFQAKALDWFGWSLERSLKYLFPVYTSWQVLQRCSGISELDADFLYIPLKIVRIQTAYGVKFYNVLWAAHDDLFKCDAQDTDAMVTMNDIEGFTNAYPLVVEEYKREIEEIRSRKEKEKAEKRKAKGKKTLKRRIGKIKDGEDSSSASTRKICSYFRPVSSVLNKSTSPVKHSSGDDDDDPLPKKQSLNSDS